MKYNTRNLIFISHATPEDNAFTLWLSTRLKLMGYEVWSDVTQLFGGEKWWDDIEQAIHQFTCKFILVITRTSLSKPGVQKEVELALVAERNHCLTNFIIPVIIDDSEFGGQPYGLSERNIIAFSTGWGPALGKLVERLSRDGVPMGEVVADLGKKLAELSSPVLQLKERQDLAVSNWLALISFPKYLNFYRIPAAPRSWGKQFEGCPFPWLEWGGMLVSFAESDVFKHYLPKHVRVSGAPCLELSAVLENAPRNHKEFVRGEVIKGMNFLIAEAWGVKMRTLGLHRYELASGKVAWFFPDSETFSGFREFADVFGVVKKRKLIGFSAKNNVFWHYAVEVKAQYGPNAKVCLIPHVVFTEDGKNPLADKTKMHRLRRGFCASWWNDRWRDLLLVHLNMISGGEEALKIPVSEGQCLSFASRPEILKSDCSLVDAGAAGPVQSAEDEFDVQVNINADEYVEVGEL